MLRNNATNANDGTPALPPGTGPLVLGMAVAGWWAATFLAAARLQGFGGFAGSVRAEPAPAEAAPALRLIVDNTTRRADEDAHARQATRAERCV